MTKMFLRLFILLLVGTFFSSTHVFAADKAFFSTEPTTNNGRKWRIGYYEGGEYINYQQILSETVRGLMKLGWIDKISLPEQKGEQTKELWRWLARNVKSDFVEFVENSHYSANWDDKVRELTAQRIISRLDKKSDIDLIIAMGTWAGKDLANNKHSTPTMVLSTTDPVSAGIIKSTKDSGFDHVHAWVDPKQYERQLRVFHEIIGFKKLGLAYEDTVSGRSYAALDAVEKMAKERQFKISRCFTRSDIANTEQASETVKQCFQKLVKKVDAIYVTEQGGVNKESIPALVTIANQHRIPTFSQAGSEEVKHGFLVSISQAGWKYVGEFHAQTFAKVFNGANPRELEQIFEQPPKIALNLETAEIVGFNPPIVILGAADEIFEKIHNRK